jgi:uncharacterized damage-inducible protein DinB
MNLLDRLLAHDTWTTRQLLLACEPLSDELLDREFDVDHRSLRQTFLHIIGNMELWTDLLSERPVEKRTGISISELLERLSVVSRDFANVAKRIDREQRYDDCFLDVLDSPPKPKTFGGAIGHLITHSMHHRAQVMFLMERVGLADHVEGDLLGWETIACGWK